MPHAEQQRWFKEQVHAHESTLKGYLRGSFPTVRDVDDVVQESYLRVWKAKAAHPIVCAKAFLFTVARHVAVDFVRRDKASPVTLSGDLESLSVLEDRPSVLDTLTKQEKISLVGDAVVALPARIRAVIILHKFQGITQVEVARQLGCSEKVIERQVAKGVQLCSRYLRARGHELF